LAETRDDPPRPLLSRLFRGGEAPTGFGKWFRANWSALAMLFLIFILALFLRSYFAYDISVDNDYIVSGGSDSYYWRRIIDYHVETGDSLYWDYLLNFPNGLRNPRPPLYSMSVAVPAVMASDLFDSISDSVGFMFVWSTAFWGALTIVPVYLLGKETFGRRAGLISAFLLAVMPSHVQRSVLSNADHDAFILFFIVLTFYFLLKAIKTQQHTRWVESWRSMNSISTGLKTYFSESRAAILYALLAGTAFGCVIMAWVGFAYVAVLMLAYLLIQVLLNRFKNIDSTSATILVMICMGFGYLIAFPVYFEQSLVAVRFDVPLYLFLAAVFFAMLFVVSRDYPWTMSLPAIGMILVVGILGIMAVYPELGEAIMTGQGYFVQNKLYSTIAEARAPKFSELAMSFGMVTFFLSLIGLVFALLKIPKRTTAGHIFIVAWMAAAIFMAISAGRFMFNAAPAFAIAAGWIVLIIVDALDFNGVRKALMGASGSFRKVFRKSIKIRHITGALFLAFFVVTPNVWFSVDAGIPSETKRSYDKQIYESLPDFMRPAGYDSINGSNWYLGAFGYSLPLPSQYYPAAWDWFAEQDADTYPETSRPAYVAWWDYGFEAVQEGAHPTIADNFQNGYQIAGNAIMAQSEEDAIALFAFRLLQFGYGSDVAKKAAIIGLFGEYGISVSEMEHILTAPGQEIIDEVLGDPDLYGPMAGDMSEVNARIVAGREALAGIGVEPLVSFYDDLCQALGWEIRYFNVDSRMFPYSAMSTGIFYAPAKLSDRRVVGSIPIDFFEIKAVTDSGSTVSLDMVTQQMNIVDYTIEYKDMFYDSMFYRAMCGFSGADVGTANTGLPGDSGAVSAQQPMPGWNMTHFRVVYRTAYYNPYPTDEVKFHQDAWQAVSYDDAADLAERIQSGEIDGAIDVSARSLYLYGTVFLKYYHGAYLNGTVTTDDGSAVAGARVTVLDEYGIPHDVTLTEGDGSYSLLAPFGNLSVVVSSGGPMYNIQLQGSKVMATFKVNVTDDQAMRVNQDLDLDGVYDYFITLDCVVPSGEVSGDVFWDVDLEGNYTATVDEPVDEGTVYVRNNVNEVVYSTELSEGYFSIAVPPGQYTVWAELMGLKMLVSEVFNVSSASDNTANLPVEPGAVIGNLTTPDGTPLADMEVYLRMATEDCELSTVTNSTGGFSFDRVIPGTYSLEVDDPDWIIFEEVVSPRRGSTIRKDYTAFERTTVKFRITLDGSPKPYAPYSLTNEYYAPNSISGFTDKFGWVEAEVPKGYWALYSVYPTGTVDYAGFAAVDTYSTESASGTLVLEEAFTVKISCRTPTGGLVKETPVVFVADDGTRIILLTNSLGEVEGRLPAGTYDVMFWAVAGNGAYSGSLTVDEDITGLRLYAESAVIASGYLWVDRDSSGSMGAGEKSPYTLMQATDSNGKTYYFRSGADGLYRMMVVEGKRIYVSLAEPGYESWMFSALFGDEVKDVTLFADPDPITVTGRVMANGVGVRGVEIVFQPDLFTLEAVSVVTGTGGYFTVPVPPSLYTVIIDQDYGLVPGVRLQHESPLVLYPSGETYVMDIAPVMRVEAYGNVFGVSDVTSVSLSGVEDVTADVTFYSYSAWVLPGTYHIQASGTTGASLFVGVLQAEVSFEDRQFDLTLSKSHNVSGVVYIGSTPAAGVVSVTATDADGGQVTTHSTSAGAFSLDVPTGDYEMSFLLEKTSMVDGRTLYVEYFASELVSVGSSDVTLTPSLAMRLDNTTFSGTVLGPDGLPTQAQITLTPNTKSGIGATIYTDASGGFSAQVQPGEYTLYVKRLQDKRVFLGVILLERNTPLDMDVTLSEGKYLYGRVTASNAGVSTAITIVSGDASLTVSSDAQGYYTTLVPVGYYSLSASTERVEGGMTIAYTSTRSTEVGAYDAYLAFDLDRQNTRSVVASWNASVALPSAPGGSVTYSFTVENTGNIGDDFTCSYSGTGFEVVFEPETQFIDFGTNGHTATVTAHVTVLDTASAGNTTVPVLIRSESSSVARADLQLMVKVQPVYSVEITVSEDGEAVSNDTTRTQISVLNSGNTEASFGIEISNLAALNTLGWDARLVSVDSGEVVDEMTIEMQATENIFVEYTAIRTDPDPTVGATVTVWSLEDPGQITLETVPILLPDLSIGPGGLEVERDDVSYEYDSSSTLMNIGLVLSIGALAGMFIFLRRKKGLGGLRKKRGDKQ
jgi:asparagine N-glycosylation enzyme membrane subunit Stt3